ncbi:hypothetical protein C1H46_021544 [Malus baccata]|uniref:Uncharacterized protein n=1 Tax=Malus baccata TaxID=106549 RepID=A0A540M269_MALBA|nr:hypothetical protein C1H46_021544 [Malus baccata]
MPIVTFVGECSGLQHGIISAILRKGCQGYLAHMVMTEDIPARVEDVQVVKDFPDIFLACHRIMKWSSPSIYIQILTLFL